MSLIQKSWLIIICGLIIGLAGINNDVAASSVGEASEDFIVRDTSGKETRLFELTRDKPVLLLLVDDGAVSEEKLSQIAELYDYYLGSELKILSIITGKDPEEAFDYADELWLTEIYTLWGDAEGEIAQLYGITQFPRVVILDNKHIVRYIGTYTTDKALTQELNRWMEEKVFNITARKFEYEPNIITVNKGDKVLIKLVAEDVEHGIYVDGYDLYLKQYLDRDGKIVEPAKADHHIKPGELGLLRFVANKNGRFSFRCTATCGSFHPYMIGYLYVRPNTTFNVGLFLILLMGFVALILSLKSKGDSTNKLFGILPLDWRFELTQFKLVRGLLKSRWFPFLLIVFNLFVFTIILLAGVIGGISAGNYNFGVMFVWILWWVLLMIVMVPLIGRVWCMMCPMPFLGEWLQRLRIFGVRQGKLFSLNKKWPKRWRNLWPIVILFFISTFANGLFTVRPIATFALLGTIIVGSIIISLIFEKRTFCLYLCSVSGFQGIYSNFSAAEVRVKDPKICKQHNLKTCFVGNEKGYGCPWMEMPFDMNRNTYCGLCMECFKTCPHDNMAFNIRPFGTDLLAERRRTDDLYRRRGTDEAFKVLTMVSILIAFFVAFQGPWGFIKDMVRMETWSGYFTYLAAYTLLTFLIVPGIYFFFVWLSKIASGNTSVSLKKVFVNFSYALIPLDLLAWGAFCVAIILPNGSYLLGVISDPFAWGWNLFGTAEIPWTPVLTGMVPHFQLVFTLVGLAFALEYGYKLAQQTYSTAAEAKRGWVPILIFLVGLAVFFHWLFVG